MMIHGLDLMAPAGDAAQRLKDIWYDLAAFETCVGIAARHAQRGRDRA